MALPPSVVGCLGRLRGLGVAERYIELERAAWIMIAAQVPHLIAESMKSQSGMPAHRPMVCLLMRWSWSTGP